MTIPAFDLNDPASLEALFGNFGMADHFRKTCLSSCAEMIRAKAADEETKITETRVNDLAHTHPIYVEFLTTCLQGRIKREQNVRDTIAQGGPFR